MASIDQLTLLEDIRLLKARYFRCVDTKDWDGWKNVFAADAEVRYCRSINVQTSTQWNAVFGTNEKLDRSDPEPVKGLENIIAFVRGVVDRAITVHHGHMPEIEVTSASTARGLWAMEDMLWFPADALYLGTYRFLHGFGHYHETYEKIDGRWLIKTLKLTRLQMSLS